MTRKNLVNFRCKHRHSAISHPRCYLNFIRGYGEVRLPKILLFDIETAPLKAYVYQKQVWGANISDDKVISEWFVLSWSAKWLYDDYVMSSRLTGSEALEENDTRIVTELWKLMNEAEIVIAHNGNSFDVPNMNTRFLIDNLQPTRPYQTIDTKRVAQRYFGFTHNSLNGLAKLFGFSPKLETNFELWKSCVNGNEKELARMEEYNRHDVELLENVYLKMRPWIKSHPNLGLYMISDGSVCPNCGSKKLQWIKNEYYYTQLMRYPLFRCECGAYGRSKKSDLTAKDRINVVSTIAR